MPADQLQSEAPAVDLARECLYRFLGVSLSYPRDAGWGLLLDAASRRLACAAADLLRAEADSALGPVGFGELPPEHLAMAPVLAELPATVEDMAAEYDRIFGLVPARECPPYETEYYPGGEAFFRSQQLADIAGYYRAFGLEPARAEPERPDHLALELEFLAFLLMKKRLALAAAGRDPDMAERAAVCDEAQRTFFQDHLAWWVPAFATGLRRKAGGGFYAAVSRVLAALIFVERCRLDVPPPRLPVQASLIERPDEQSGCGGCPAQG
jgi:TorA maturation chaperone TorD